MCSHENPDTIIVPEEKRLEVALQEYKAAQDSAQHYNSLLWQVISIFTAANAILLAAVGSALFGGRGHWLRLSFVAGIATLGLVVNLASLRFTHVFRSYQSQKLDRCKKLEGNIRNHCGPVMTNHTGVFSHEGVQKSWYYVLEGALLLIWTLLLIASLCRLRCG